MRTKENWLPEELPHPTRTLEDNEERERADSAYFRQGAAAFPCGFCKLCDRFHMQERNGEGWLCPTWPEGIPEDVAMSADPEKHRCMVPEEEEVFTGRKWRMLPDGELEWID